jgi:hypothetical protein
MFGRAVFSLVALAATFAVPVSSASAANILDLNFGLSGPSYEGQLPPCDDRAALKKIAARFSEKEGSFWRSNLEIKGFEAVRETGFRSWAANSIPRRFCSGYALLSDGARRPVHYSIAEDQGMIGMSWGVEWCIVGLDRNMAYSPACRMAQP